MTLAEFLKDAKNWPVLGKMRQQTGKKWKAGRFHPTYSKTSVVAVPGLAPGLGITKTVIKVLRRKEFTKKNCVVVVKEEDNSITVIAGDFSFRYKIRGVAPERD